MQRPQFFFLLSLLFCLNLLGCGESSTEVTTEPTQNEVATTPEKQTEEKSPPVEEKNAVKKSSDAPADGWKKIAGSGMELMMPASFDGGVPSEDLDLIVGKIREIGPEFEKIAAMIEQNPTMFKLMAFDANVGKAGFLTNINVVQEAIPSAFTLDDYLKAMKTQLPPEFKIVEEKTVEINSYPASKLTIELNMADTMVKEAIYIIKTDGLVWVVTCATSMDEFAERAATFEKIANSFTLTP